MKKEFIEYENDNNTIPYKAHEVCFCVTDYARKYLKENRIIIGGIDQNVRDAILTDAINYLGKLGCIDFGIYTKDLYAEVEDRYIVDDRCLISAIVNHYAHYLFNEKPIELINANKHMNNLDKEIKPDDVAFVIVDFLNFILDQNNYERVYTLMELKNIAEVIEHNIEMRKLKKFLESTSEYSEALARGEDIVKLYRKMSENNKLNYVDKNDVYHYTKEYEKKLGRSEMFSWDKEVVREKIYAMTYAFGKINPHEDIKMEVLQRTLREMRNN